MRLNIKTYFKISTIHGLSYFSKRFHLVERIFWIIALIFSICCTSYLIVQLVVKIQNFPIVVYLSDQPVSVSEINFPAVSLCSKPLPYIAKDKNPYGKFFRYEKHTSKRYYYEHREFFNEMQDEIKIYNDTLTKIFRGDHQVLLNYYDLINRINNKTIDPRKLKSKILKRLQVFDLIEKMGFFEEIKLSIYTNDFVDVLNEFMKEFEIDTGNLQFSWINNLNSHVSELLTPFGLCYTFNLPSAHDLLNLNSTSEDFHYQFIFDENLEGEHPPVDLPRKISTSKEGLLIDALTRLQIIIPKVFEGRGYYQYHVMVQDPYELPSEKSKAFSLKSVKDPPFVLVSSQINTIDDSIRTLNLADRNCYLNNEKVLKFFKFYTKINCERECLTEFMISRCGCVEFFMIRNSTTRICPASLKKCYDKARSDFEDLKSICKCHHQCDHIQYSFEMEERELSSLRYTRASAKVRVRFKNDAFRKYIRKKQFDTFDFLSFVGGILGLFAGFSALSFFEVIYWFTIRLLIGSSKKFENKVSPMNKGTQNNARNRNFFDILITFLNESSIHGLKYILNFSKIDSFLWICFVLSSLTLCIHMISSVHEKVPDSRIVAFDDGFKFIDDIPYPAFTFVPGFTIDKSMQISQLTWVLNTLNGIVRLPQNETEMENFIRGQARFRFCAGHYDMYSSGLNITFLPYIFRMLKEETKVNWFKLQYSSFNRKYQPEFAEIRTIRGMGFSFNLIDSNDMFNLELLTQEYNYTKNVTTRQEKLQFFPNNTKIPLKFDRENQAILTINILKIPTSDVECIKSSFLIHQPDHLPTFNAKHDFISFVYGTTLNIIVTPEVVKTEPNLEKLDPKVRECYFEGEKSLKFFKKYSQSNCEIECMTNFTVAACGCVDIEQPIAKGFVLCLNDVKYAMSYCPTRSKRDLLTSEHFSIEKNCSCLPMCNSVNYNVQYFTEYVKMGNETTINVKMNMDDIILFRRYQQFTFSDVVSYAGGLLGLFAGISMLSIVEFFYFIIIRPVVNFLIILRTN